MLPEGDLVPRFSKQGGFLSEFGPFGLGVAGLPPRWTPRRNAVPRRSPVLQPREAMEAEELPARTPIPGCAPRFVEPLNIVNNTESPCRQQIPCFCRAQFLGGDLGGPLGGQPQRSDGSHPRVWPCP